MLKAQDLQTEITSAMKGKNQDRVTILKLFKNLLDTKRIDEKLGAITDISDEGVQVVARSFMKKLVEEKEHIVKAKKDTTLIDLQIATIGEFLPKAISEDEIKTFLVSVIAEKGIVDKKGIGILMGAVKQKWGTAVDMGIVSKLVKELI